MKEENPKQPGTPPGLRTGLDDGPDDIDERVAHMHETEHLGHADLKENSIEISIEMSLSQWVDRLPLDHRARLEFTDLQQRAQPMEGVTSTAIDGTLADYIRRRRRTHRIEIASRVLAAVVMAQSSLTHLDPTVTAKEAVEYADALLTRIDETK